LFGLSAEVLDDRGRRETAGDEKLYGSRGWGLGIEVWGFELLEH
jgi:hypothetical protein